MSSKKSPKNKSPAQQERTLEATLHLQTKREAFAGPIPAPWMLAEYDQALPGTAELIRSEFLANGAHTRKLEMMTLQFRKEEADKNRKAAQYLVWGALLAAVGLALSGHEAVASTIAVSTVGAVVTGFLHQRKAIKEAQAQPEGDKD